MSPENPDPGAAGATDAENQAAQRALYREAFEFAPDAQLVTDMSGLILDANQAAANLFKSPKEFLLRKPLPLYAPPGGRTRLYEALAMFARGTSADWFETGLIRHRGERIDVQVHLRSSEGRALHWSLRDVTEWKRTTVSQAELQRRLATAQEDERHRVSRDLHDTVGQTLTGLMLGIEAVKLAGPLPPAALAKLGYVRQLADDLGRQLHELASRLRPTVLDDLGLVAAAQQLVADWGARSGMQTEFQATSGERFPPEIETALYRVIQEALTNVLKHAGARQVSVIVGHHSGHAVAMVEDDGIGFDPNGDPRTPLPGARARIGLLGLRERITLVGGTLEIESRPGAGTTVLARVPVPAPAD